MLRFLSTTAQSKRNPASLDQLLQSAHELLIKYRTGRIDDAKGAASLISSLGEHSRSPAAVNTSLDLVFKSHPHPTISNPVLKHWRTLLKTKPKLTLSHNTIVSKLPSSSQDDATTAILLDSVLHTKGLTAAEEFLKSRKSNTVFLLNQLLKAYADNGAEDKLEQLLANDLSPEKRNKYTLSILLSYYSKRGSYDKAKDMLALHKDFELDDTMYVQMVSIHCHREELNEAIEIIRSKLQNSKNLGLAAQCVLRALRKQLSDNKRSVRRKTVDKVKEFYVSIESKMKDDHDSNDKLLATLLDIFAFARRQDDAHEAFAKVNNPNIVHYGIMMKHYKWQNQADRALSLLKDMLDNDDEVPLSIGLFNSVFDALASSNQPNQISKALETYHLLIDHPRCQMVGLKPDIATFGCLVRFFTAAGKSAEPLLHMMRTHGITPDSRFLAGAAASCLKEGDLVACERILGQIDTLGVHAYQEIARKAFPEGVSLDNANKTRNLIMGSKGQLTQPFALNLVLAVWSMVNSHHRYSAMRKLVKNLSLPNDGKTYSLLIVTLSYSRKVEDIEIAEEFALRSHRTKSAFVHVRDGYLRLNQPSKAARLLFLQHDAGVSPNGFDLFTVVKVYMHQNMTDDAFSLVEDMKRLIPDFPLPQNAMRCLEDVDDTRARKLAALFRTKAE